MKLKKLNKREKYIVYGVAGLIGLLILVQLIVKPVLDRRDRLQRNLQATAIMLEEMRRLQTEYQGLQDKAEVLQARFGRRAQDFTLFSFLDRLAGEAGIKDRISYMKPSRTFERTTAYKISRVEMKLEAITLEQLAAYLHGVETSENMVSIRKASISKKDQTQGLLNAVLQVETLEI
ncbi:MAG: type II secretion system protein M [Desulfobacterales bacterium]|nr:MAG: type II secretion system protein M [Desulfobacterales bacterium]